VTPPGEPAEWVWLARIRRSQGRKGEVFAEILTDFPERFAQRRQLWLLREGVTGARPPAGFPSARAIQLTNHWLHKGGVVLHFAGVESISEAETLTGMIVAIPREERAALGEDEFYIGDLIGCILVDVATGEATSVGEIENVERGVGPVPMLIVRGTSGEVLVPFVKSYLRRIDLEARRVEMALPEGLTDLNA
jgi:16S rRNA processing protein RimM